MLPFTLVNSLFLLAVLSSILCAAECERCFVDGMQVSTDAYAGNYNMGFQDFVVVNFERRSFETLCVGSLLLCIDSMLPGTSSLKRKPESAASRFSRSDESGVVQPLGSIRRQPVRWMSYSSWLTDQNMFRVSKGRDLSNPLRGCRNEFCTRYGSMVQRYVYTCKAHVIDQKIKETLKSRNTDVIKVVPFDGSSLSDPPCLRHHSAIADSNLTNTYVYPHAGSYLGKIFFHISNPCAWQISFFMRNNLSDLQMPIYAYSWSGYKDLYAKILTAEVRNVGKKACLLGELIVHTTTSLALEPGESVTLLISYKADCFATSAHHNIEFPVIADGLATRMRASLTPSVINLPRKFVFLVQMNKCCVIPLLAAFLLLWIFCCLFLLPEAVRTEDCLYKNASETISATKNFVKVSHVCRNMKNKTTSLSSGELRIQRQESVYKNPDQGMDQHKLASLHGKGNGLEDTYYEKISAYFPQSPVAIVNFNSVGTSPTAELTTRKRKDRKKQQDKKTGGAARLTDFFNDSSSIGGNYTPSSPTSSVTILMQAPTFSLYPDNNVSNEPKSLFSQAADEHKRKSQVSVNSSEAKVLEYSVSIKFKSTRLPPPYEHSLPRKTYSGALMLSFSAFHCASRPASDLVCCSPILASRSIVSPYERAPGSELSKQKNAKTEESTKLGDMFTYDIWGDHWSGLCLMRKPKDVSVVSGSDSNSFFVKGPQAQALLAEIDPRSLSVHQNG